MGRKSRAKQERRAQRLADRRYLNQMLKSSDPSAQVADCPSCGSVTMSIHASGLYEGLALDLPQLNCIRRTCPDYGHRTEIIS